MDNKTIYYGVAPSESIKAKHQIRAFKQHDASDQNIIIDKVSAHKQSRPGYQALKHGKLGLHEGDNLIVYDIYNLSSTKKGIKEELEYWINRGVYVMFITIPSSLSEIPQERRKVQELITQILIDSMALLAKKDAEYIKRKQREGIAAMPKINGKKYSAITNKPTGRPPIRYPQKWAYYYTKWKGKEINAKECMALLNLKKNTFYNLVKKCEQE